MRHLGLRCCGAVLDENGIREVRARIGKPGEAQTIVGFVEFRVGRTANPVGKTIFIPGTLKKDGSFVFSPGVSRNLASLPAGRFNSDDIFSEKECREICSLQEDRVSITMDGFELREQIANYFDVDEGKVTDDHIEECADGFREALDDDQFKMSYLDAVTGLGNGPSFG